VSLPGFGFAFWDFSGFDIRWVLGLD